MKPAELTHRFEEAFGVPPTIFTAPGRVNIIGEHTDYNDGFVMPAAIDLTTSVAISPRPDRKLILRSENMSGQFEFDIDNLPKVRLGQWCDYVLGVAVVLRGMGHHLHGANILVHGGVPIGAGLSSSAAIEVAVALAFLNLVGETIPLPELAKLCRRAENEFVGAHVGIMDQFTSCMGKRAHALLLDCRSLHFELLPLPVDLRLVVCNTMVKRQLSQGEYNRRREECEEAVRLLRNRCPEIRALRDVSRDLLKQYASDLPEVLYRRSLHVVQENQRVLESAECLTEQNLVRLGELLRESHRSLRDFYEVSCSHLDAMVEAAEGLAGYYGGRMMGGGFGGCTINLVNAEVAPAFVAQIAERYERRTGMKPDVYVCSAADGAGVVNEAST